MRSWLKSIGSFDRPITDHPFYGSYNEEWIGFRKANKPGVRNGDHLSLYAPGGSKRIFAWAEAITDPDHDPGYDSTEHGSCRWRIRVKYRINLPVASGVSIYDVIAPERDLSQSIRQQSHIKLSLEEYESISENLKANAASSNSE